MRSKILAVAIAGGLLAGCTADVSNNASSTAQDAKARAPRGGSAGLAALEASTASIADAPDHGSLFAYDEVAPVSKGAFTWHRVEVSEAHAMRAVATGTMEVSAPDGTPIRLKYDHKIEHGDGNWTWVGRPEGAQPGTEAVITFGQKAVFGSVPYKDQPLQLTTVGGKTFAIETDARRLAASGAHESDRDFLVPSAADAAAPLASLVATASAHKLSSSVHKLSGAALTAQSLTPSSVATTLDIVLGYTTGFAARFGGDSGALTRLHALVDLANTAFANSLVDGRLRLVATVKVDYPDATTNRGALFELTGMNCVDDPGAANLPALGASCSFVGQPASLLPLANAREAVGADLVALVRNYSDSNDSCGLGWMNGGGQSTIDAEDAPFGFAVVSDTNGNANPDPVTGDTCRSETLGHEFGHNLGLQHDVQAAAGANGTLEPDEFGIFPYSFGYSTDVGTGNFYTLMSVRRANQTGYLVFANPRITSCGGVACGATDSADNARSLAQTLPLVARFRKSVVPMAGTWVRGDFNKDNRDDLVWRNRSTGQNSIWRSANASATTPLLTVNNFAWDIVGSGDFNGDGASDLLWRNETSGQNQIWLSGNSKTAVVLSTVPSTWYIAGAGDFDGDGKSDILWRNPTTGQNSLWLQGASSRSLTLGKVAGNAWQIVGVADFDGDGRSDILWRNTVTGANTYWRRGAISMGVSLSTVADQSWLVAGVGDFNKDGKADILWRNIETGANSIWRSAASSLTLKLTPVSSPSWAIIGTGDFDGDGASDIVWRNLLTGQNQLWRSGASSTATVLASVPAPWWVIQA